MTELLKKPCNISKLRDHEKIFTVQWYLSSYYAREVVGVVFSRIG
jgi:hypothetical protein